MELRYVPQTEGRGVSDCFPCPMPDDFVCLRALISVLKTSAPFFDHGYKGDRDKQGVSSTHTPAAEPSSTAIPTLAGPPIPNICALTKAEAAEVPQRGQDKR